MSQKNSVVGVVKVWLAKVMTGIERLKHTVTWQTLHQKSADDRQVAGVAVTVDAAAAVGY